MGERHVNPRHTGPAPVRVVVEHDRTQAIVHDRVGDHNDPDLRKWIVDTTFWAIRNEHTVYIRPME